jgi:hypothetical protein
MYQHDAAAQGRIGPGPAERMHVKIVTSEAGSAAGHFSNGML